MIIVPSAFDVGQQLFCTNIINNQSQSKQKGAPKKNRQSLLLSKYKTHQRLGSAYQLQNTLVIRPVFLLVAVIFAFVRMLNDNENEICGRWLCAGIRIAAIFLDAIISKSFHLKTDQQKPNDCSQFSMRGCRDTFQISAMINRPARKFNSNVNRSEYNFVKNITI